MKKLVLLPFLAVVCCMSIAAQDKTADIKRLFELMQSEKTIDDMMDNMLAVFQQQAEGKIQGAAAKEKYDEYVEFMKTEVRDLSDKMVNQEMVDIYNRHFTQEEIKDLIRFYETPTGKKLIEKNPEVTKDLMNSMMTKYMPEFQGKLASKLKDLSVEP